MTPNFIPNGFHHVENCIPFPRQAVPKTLDQALAGNIHLKPEWMRGL
jgi:hypothetical protein